MSQINYQEFEGHLIAMVKPGIFHVRVPDGVVFNESLLRKLFEYYQSQWKGNFAIISEFPGLITEMSGEVKKYASGNSLPKHYKARAIIVSSLPVRLETKNFMLRYSPKLPTEIVSGLEEGIEFVSQFL